MFGQQVILSVPSLEEGLPLKIIIYNANNLYETTKYVSTSTLIYHPSLSAWVQQAWGQQAWGQRVWVQQAVQQAWVQRAAQRVWVQRAVQQAWVQQAA